MKDEWLGPITENIDFVCNSINFVFLLLNHLQSATLYLSWRIRFEFPRSKKSIFKKVSKMEEKMRKPSRLSVVASNLLTMLLVLVILGAVSINVDRVLAQGQGPDGPVGGETTGSTAAISEGDGLQVVDIPLVAMSSSGDGTPEGYSPVAPEAALIDPLAPDMLAPAFSYYRLVGTAFNTRTSATTYAYSFNGCVYLNGGTDNRLMAPLLLPDGAVIKFLRLYYDDTDVTNDITAWITRYQPGVTSEDITSIMSTGSAGFGTMLSAELDHIVDLTNWAYTVIIAPNSITSATSFCGIRVAYYAPDAYAIALPTVIKGTP